MNDVSYYRLIKAFSLGLKPKNGDYYDGVTFRQIEDLYKFNCNFRQILFGVIERIEINLMCRPANYFSYKYGVLGYENPENFADNDHYCRLYYAKLPKTPKLYDQYDGIKNNKVFGVLLCMSRLIPHDIHWDTFVNELDCLIEKYTAVRIETMGFPENWMDLLSEPNEL